MVATALGEYLRARRAQVRPEDAAIPVHGVRRVPGLRREEVATLAGVSIDYYVRLEQGREKSPSVPVLEALAGALDLDDDARLHLFRVAGLTPQPRHATVPERVDPELLRLLGMWTDNPAFVLGRAFDVLAGNPLAYALFPGFERGPNLLATIFLDPAARAFYPDWDAVARYTVAGFRLVHGQNPDDARVAEVVADLTAGSDAFARIWERHDARGRRLETKRFRHPEVGELTLHINAFDVRAAPGQELIVYHAAPGTQSADALRLLGALAATRSARRAEPGTFKASSDRPSTLSP